MKFLNSEKVSWAEFDQVVYISQSKLQFSQSFISKILMLLFGCVFLGEFHIKLGLIAKFVIQE